ncbi:nuclear transport factor 2 family protein [Mesorhizobium sp. VK22B]|uniref:Nuclear transport factor 2 family protein n=1 Tax=Mesorhizobium captivum TaxID=3072319 RepID=A0ABU4Z516_9HYPH|nr:MULTISPECIES: nuclear transport factor 2 family protein [unclassified Mesorhizobium]MDX8493164.1 nuclear transport factor 2 family protein [Mesorhizobium sp. VK22B]MDX8504393.1 nuclear transport factor 2 family protein [Mesorhizobium sp. VK22E]
MSSNTAIDHEVVALELALLRAPTRHDPDFLKIVLDDDMIEFGKSGYVYDKERILEALSTSNGEPAPDDLLEMTSVRTVQLAPEVVLLIYKLRSRGGPAAPSLRSSVWRR